METDHVMREPAPHFDELAQLSNRDLIDRFAIGVERIDKRVFEFDDEMLDTAFLESAGVGKWPARVLIGHLAECEVLNTYRLRRLAAEDGVVFDGFEPDSYIDNGLYNLKPQGSNEESARAACGAFVATIHTLRAWNRDWLNSIPETTWERKGMHAVRGEFSFKRLLALSTWHIEYHAYFLTKKVELLLGNTATQP